MSVRPARAADLPSILALHEQTFGRPLHETAWRWKFARHAAHSIPLVWVAVDAQERLIGHYGAVPREIRLGKDSPLTAMTAFDGMTDARVRRQGVYTRLVRHAHEAWREAGVACVLGLPNEQYGSRLQALDWRLLFSLRWFLRPLRPEALLARKLRVPFLGRLTAIGGLWNRLADRPLMPPVSDQATGEPAATLAVHSGADAAFEALAESLNALDRGLLDHSGLDRGSAWLTWRYLESRPHRYQLHTARNEQGVEGYLAWRFDRESPAPFGLIAETHAPTDAVHDALLLAAITAMRKQDALAVAALAVPGSVTDRRLRRAGFRFSWGSFDVRCVPLRDDLPWNRLQDRLRLAIAGGDFDVV